MKKEIVLDYTNKMFPMEHLVFQLENPETLEEFIQKDHDIWTAYLSQSEGFISKEIWINTEVPGEVHSVLVWKTMSDWKAFPIEDLKAKDKEFITAYGYKFELVRRIHKENNHGIHKVRHYELKNIE